MSQHPKGQDVINIDDDNDRGATITSSEKNNNKFINNVNFPRLSSILQKWENKGKNAKEKDVKTEGEEAKTVPPPKIMPMPITETELLVDSIIRLNQSKTILSSNQGPNIHKPYKEEPKVIPQAQPSNSQIIEADQILMVEEDEQPLTKAIPKSLTISSQNKENQNVDSQELDPLQKIAQSLMNEGSVRIYNIQRSNFKTQKVAQPQHQIILKEDQQKSNEQMRRQCPLVIEIGGSQVFCNIRQEATIKQTQMLGHQKMIENDKQDRLKMMKEKIAEVWPELVVTFQTLNQDQIQRLYDSIQKIEIKNDKSQVQHIQSNQVCNQKQSVLPTNEVAQIIQNNAFATAEPQAQIINTSNEQTQTHHLQIEKQMQQDHVKQNRNIETVIGQMLAVMKRRNDEEPINAETHSNINEPININSAEENYKNNIAQQYQGSNQLSVTSQQPADTIIINDTINQPLQQASNIVVPSISIEPVQYQPMDEQKPDQIYPLANEQLIKQTQVHEATKNVLDFKDVFAQTQISKQMMASLDTNPAAVLLQLKNSTIDNLRERMIQFFPDNKEAINQMNHQQLKDILQEAIDQFQKQNTVGLSQPAEDNIHQQTLIQINDQTQAVSTCNAIENGPSLQEMKAVVVNWLPDLRKQIQQKMSTQSIKDLYAKSKTITAHQKTQSKNQQKKVINPQKTIADIMQFCVEKFPHLKDDLIKLNQVQIRQVYEQLSQKIDVPKTTTNKTIVSNKVSEPVKSATAQQLSKTPQQVAQPTKTVSLRPTQPVIHEQGNKRSYESMANRKTVQHAAKMDNSNEKGSNPTKKVNIPEIRAKLIKKLPELKQKIILLSDADIQKIFNESLQPPANVHPSNAQKPIRIEQQNKKPTHQQQKQKNIINLINQPINHNQPTTQVTVSPATISEVVVDKQQLINNRSGHSTTQVFELRDRKKKKCKTYLLLHTEESDQDEIVDSLHKMKKTENGVQRKCVCECCKNEDLPSILKKLVTMMQKQQ